MRQKAEIKSGGKNRADKKYLESGKYSI